jgi:response regulator NasT
MDRALIVSATPSGAQFVCELLAPAEYSPVTVASSGNEARRLLAETDFGLVVVNAPLADEFGHELACMAARSSTAGVIILVKSERADEGGGPRRGRGRFRHPQADQPHALFSGPETRGGRPPPHARLKKENHKLQTKIEEIRLIDRAKCALIQCLLMTEPQAHRYIEKQAMDLA